jgi:flagellar motility protein MotE (MotC chaperone)
MKKILAVAVALPLCAAALTGSLVAGVNLSGGLPPSRGWVTDIPLIGSYVRVREKLEEEKEAPSADATSAEEPAGGEKRSVLDLAPRDRLAQLCEQLEKRSMELEAEKRQLREERAELKAWEQELTRVREELLKDLKEERDRVKALRQEVAAAEKALEDKRVEIARQKEKNLEKTAAIFGRMDAAGGARILTKMYESGDEETVVKILYLMRDRNAAKLLDEIPDPEMSAQVTRRLSYVQQNENPIEQPDR